MQVFGITGGIATGKSTVTQMLADLGAPTINADVIAHALLVPGTLTTLAVLMAFPDCADPTDSARQTIDRRTLSRLVFADPTARVRLEALTHPAIIAALLKQITAWREADDALAAAAEIPLLFEAGLERLVDTVVGRCLRRAAPNQPPPSAFRYQRRGGPPTPCRSVAAGRKSRAGRCRHHN